MDKSADDNLGFSFTVSKKGDLVIYHWGKVATRFSRTRGVGIAEKLREGTEAEQQQLMARLTGNYKHGNERISQGQ